MDNLILKQILSETSKMPETIDEFIVEISKRNLSDDAILRSIKAIEEEIASGNSSQEDQIELETFSAALKFVLENRNAI